MLSLFVQEPIYLAMPRLQRTIYVYSDVVFSTRGSTSHQVKPIKERFQKSITNPPNPIKKVSPIYFQNIKKKQFHFLEPTNFIKRYVLGLFTRKHTF